MASYRFPPRPRLPAGSPVRSIGVRCGFLAWAVLALVACGGGSTSDPATAGQPAVPTDVDPDVDQQSVTIHVTTSAGTPVPGVGISLNGGFDGRAADTDATGSVRFDDIPTGEEATATSYAAGFHAAHTRFLVTVDADTDVTLVIEHVTEATPVVLGSRAVAASDGHSLTVDVDLAVLGEDGRANPTLTAAEFSMRDSDCAFVPCGYDADSGSLPMGGYRALADDEAFGWQRSSDQPVPPMTVALLLEQSAAMADYDRQGLRLPAVSAFLESVIPPDTVALATYRGTSSGPILTTYGAFTSDGAQFGDAVNQLAGQEAGGNPLPCAVIDMLSFTEEHAPSKPAATVVVVTNSNAAGPDACTPDLSPSDATEPRIPVVAIGGNESGAALAAQSGGSFVVVTDPAQFPVAVGNLAPIVGRTLDYNHLRFVLTPEGASATGPVFRSGQTIWAYVQVRVGMHTSVTVPLVMQVQ